MAEQDVEASLVLRRSRRSTAGNRMEAALAEMAALQPDPEIEADDDKDFVGPAEEEEVFDSDFQSTDEEDGQDYEEEEEKEIAAEEKHARKAARQHAVRVVEARAASLTSGSKRTLNTNKQPTTINVRDRTKSASVKRADVVGLATKRKSQRRSTILSSQILNLRLKDAEERKAALPKRLKESSSSYSQAELLARALDTEEGNIISHRNYLQEEEEKRKRARVVRQKLTGPILSWISCLEDETAALQTQSLITPSLSSHPNGTSDVQSGACSQGPSSSTETKTYTAFRSPGSAPLPNSYFASSTAVQALSQPSASSQAQKSEKVNKNYLIHRVDEGVPAPSWSDTMGAVFGSHVNWEEVKVYSGKHRPLSRPVQRCPITGRTAIYRDPRSGVPFAGVDAFRVLSRLLSHEYVWNDEIQCYTADEKVVQLEPEIDESMDDLPATSAA